MSEYEDLIREMTTRVIVDTGLTESIAHQCAVAVMASLQDRKAANGLLYVSSPPRRLDLLQIEADFRAGKSIREICRRHRTSRRRLQQAYPNGFPKSDHQHKNHG